MLPIDDLEKLELPGTVPECHALIRQLFEVIRALRTEGAELRAQLNRNSQNSSQPPSQDGPSVKLPSKKKRSGRRPGGQPGHRGHRRELVPPERVDATEDHYPEECEECGRRFAGGILTEVGEPVRHQVIDAPVVRANVTEHRFHTLMCVDDDCGHATAAWWPVEVPRGNFGPRLQGMIGLFRGSYRLSKRTVVGALSDLMGVTISLGSVGRCENALSEALREPAAEAHRYVQEQANANADETGWKEKAKRAWLWVATTTLVTVFLIQATRGKQAAMALLGGFKGTLNTDRWVVYAHWPVRMRQLCWSHLIRDWTFIEEVGGKVGETGKALLAAKDEMFVLWYRVRDGTLGRSTFQRRLIPIRQRVEELLLEGSLCDHKKAKGMCKQILKLKGALWTFARVPGAEPTNNAAERVLRQAVLWRKGSFGTQSAEGSRFTERILTTVTTLRQQRRHVLEFLTEAASAAMFGRHPPSLLPLSEAPNP